MSENIFYIFDKACAFSSSNDTMTKWDKACDLVEKYLLELGRFPPQVSKHSFADLKLFLLP